MQRGLHSTVPASGDQPFIPLLVKSFGLAYARQYDSAQRS